MSLVRFVIRGWKTIQTKLKQMKTRIIASFIGLLITIVSFSQTSGKTSISKTDEFSSKTGRIIKKEFADVDTYKGCEFKILTITDLVSNEKIIALRIEKEVTGSYSSSTKIAVLDADEIDGLLKALQVIKDNMTTTPTVYTEIIFNSRGGFEAGAFYDVDKAKWSVYIKLEEHDNDSYVFMKSEDMDPLIAVIEKAKSSITK
jgi:hypothetical protein